MYFCVVHLILIEILALDMFYTGKLFSYYRNFNLKNHSTYWNV